MAGPGAPAFTLFAVESAFKCTASGINLVATQPRIHVQALFSLGFALASLYHICHMHEAGLQESSLLGISGPVWRTFDILCAQWLLGRTFSHAIGASHWVTRGMLLSTALCTTCLSFGVLA